MAKRMTWWVLLGALAAVPGRVPVAAQSATEGMVPNPSAEVGAAQPEGWTSRGKATFAWEGEAAHEGQRSLKIRYSDVDAEWSSSPFKVDGSYATEYPWVVVSAWVKTERTSGLTYLRISWWRDGQEVGEGRTAPLPHGTADWTRVRLAALPAVGATEGRVGLCSQGNVGAAWFDDVAASSTSLPASGHSLGEPVAAPYQAFLDDYPKSSWAADALERLLAFDEAAGRWEDVVDRLKARAKASVPSESYEWEVRLAQALLQHGGEEAEKARLDSARQLPSAKGRADAAKAVCVSGLGAVERADAAKGTDASRQSRLAMLHAQCVEGSGDLEKAIMDYGAVAERFPELALEASFRAAMALGPRFGRRDAPTLTRCRQSLLKVRPSLEQDPAGQDMLLRLDFDLAETAFFSKQYDQALLDFQRVVDSNPVFAKRERAQYFMAQVHFHRGEYTEALAEYAALEPVRQKDLAAEIYYYKGLCLISLDRYQECEEWVKTQEAQFPAGAESVRLRIAEALYKAGRYGESLAVCESSGEMSENGRQVRAYWNRTVALIALGRTDEARQWIVRFRESFPDRRAHADMLESMASTGRAGGH